MERQALFGGNSLCLTTRSLVPPPNASRLFCLSSGRVTFTQASTLPSEPSENSRKPCHGQAQQAFNKRQATCTHPQGWQASLRFNTHRTIQTDRKTAPSLESRSRKSTGQWSSRDIPTDDVQGLLTLLPRAMSSLRGLMATSEYMHTDPKFFLYNGDWLLASI